MYISRLIMGRNHPLALRSVADPYEMHRTIWSAFPAAENVGPGRILFRVEPPKNDNQIVVLVQSHVDPDWSGLLADGIIERAECKTFALRFLNGQVLRFRLLANPAKKITYRDSLDVQGRPKKARVGLFGEEKQVAWLERKAEAGGFTLLDCRVTSRFNVDCKKPAHNGTIRHYAVLFDGILQVKDASAFVRTIETGVGPAKGFGFGLLSVAPCR